MQKFESHSPHWDWVTPLLAIGGRIPVPIEPRAFSSIRRVVDLRAEDRDDSTDLRRLGIRFLHLPTPDLQPPSCDALTLGVHWIRDAWGCQEAVLVHCEHGIGRSAILCACALISTGSSPGEALRKLKLARARVSPSPDQLHQLLTWSALWNQHWPSESWDKLARIVYTQSGEPGERPG